LLASILFTLGNSSDSFIILRGQERGLNVIQVMLMLMTFNLVYTLLAGPFGALSDKIGRRKVDHRGLAGLWTGLPRFCAHHGLTLLVIDILRQPYKLAHEINLMDEA
jgi:MFS family permease